MNEIVLGSVLFVATVLILASAIIAARALLVSHQPVEIRVNGQRGLKVRSGEKLLTLLNGNGVRVPAACGGKGTCGQCRVTVRSGAGDILPTERDLIARRDLARGTRLACQVTVRRDLDVEVSEAILGARSHRCRVISSRTVAPLIREIVLALPEGERMEFRAGAFVQVTAPRYRLNFAEYRIATEHRDAWNAMGVSRLTAFNARPQSRAYSIANTVEDGKDRVILLVRLALPPPDRPHAPPGVVSSYLFGLGNGDMVDIEGPYGDFGVQDTDREMIFIGGGVGMAPLRAMISRLLHEKTERKIRFWYGARSEIDVFYREEFDRLQREHANFQWNLVLSEPKDPQSGRGRFVHEAVREDYLARHPAPEDCEYYLCGPPLMIRAVLAMLDDLGVELGQIFNDDFGS